jgi:hypothetical protein
VVSIAVVVVTLLHGAPPAGAHSGGRAVPVIDVTVRESGPLRALVDLRVHDEDGGEPVRGAEVRGVGEMTRPHTMYTYFGPLPEVAPGRYRATVKLPMTATWKLDLTVGGARVVPRTASVSVRIDRSALTEPQAADAAQAVVTPAATLVGAVRYEISAREARDMAVLWVHGIAATAWIVGIALLLAAVTAGSGSLVPESRRRLARWYRRWGFPLTWLAAVVLVATGIYNMLRVSPFTLVWRPADLAGLAEIPYGRLYEGVLVAKLTLFGVMVITGLVAALRAPRGWGDDDATAGSGPRLVVQRVGVPGVIFVACAPLVVAAVVALRYVHILSHVAEASGS